MTVYFDTNWAILSTIGLANIFFSFVVIGITKLTFLSAVPIVVSASCAVANGLSYYCEDTSTHSRSTATVYAVADILWMIQEAGLSFYSYAIVTRILRGRQRLVFVVLFWTLMVCILVARVVLLVFRFKALLSEDTAFKSMVNGGHIGYFVSLALVECLSAFFLLRTFAAAKRTSEQVSLKSDLFTHLMRSTEMRLALLALIGVAGAVTFFFQPPVSGGTSISSQIDGFLYTLECLFPVILFIDMLASKLAFTQNSQNESYCLSNRRPARRERLNSGEGRRPPATSTWEDCPEPNFGRITEITHQRPATPDRDVTPSGSLSGTSQTGILKTIGITIHTTN